MSEIDWSKAPEGATHARDCGWESPDWYKVSNGVLMVVSCGEPWEESGYSSLDKIPGVQERPSEAWTGTGIPPVGINCEYMKRGTSDWFHCSVIASHDGGVVVAVHESDLSYSYWQDTSHFRPIRTQEQIEADERGRAIDEMYAIVREGIYDKYALCSELYDAGYRKQGEAK